MTTKRKRHEPTIRDVALLFHRAGWTVRLVAVPLEDPVMMVAEPKPKKRKGAKR